MRKKLIYSFLIVFVLFMVLLNYIAYNHSYNFTHYANIKENKLKVADNSKLGFTDKLGYIFRGVQVPRPKNLKQPEFLPIEDKINTPKGKIEVWKSDLTDSKGTVLMFHGYSNRKTSLISRARLFTKMNYNVVLVDFLGSGGSDGDEVSIGYFEADQVKSCYDDIVAKTDSNVYLFGISMGAVAIMKSVKDNQLPVKGIILECPFGNMKTTVKKRFNNFGIPTFPLADLLMIWGSYHAGYWTYNHNPIDYAEKIKCPVLLMHGEYDHAVTKKEIDDIYKNLTGTKFLKTFKRTGHDIFASNNEEEWNQSIMDFMISTGTYYPRNFSPFYMDESESTGVQ